MKETDCERERAERERECLKRVGGGRADNCGGVVCVRSKGS